VATLLADPPAAPGAQQAGPPPGALPGAAPVLAAQSGCVSCGAPMRSGQDWCVHCGAGAPGSLAAPSSDARTVATVLAAVALLVAGAAAAAYAAFGKSGAKRHSAVALVHTPAVSLSTPQPASPPAAITPPPAVPKAGALGALKTRSPLVKPSKPLVGTGAKSPAATTPSTTRTTTTPTVSGTKTQPASETGTPAAKPAAPIVLDTNAASTYNPGASPASWFGDPSLAIDGETATSWTAQVDPATAPRMAAGLLIDLKSDQKLSALELTTATPGMTIQVFASIAAVAPHSITDPAWVHLTKPLIVKQRKMRIALSDPKQAFRFVTTWISKAPASAVGTPAAPGRVRINEIEFFAPS
jgi:hypothetical protein